MSVAAATRRKQGSLVALAICCLSFQGILHAEMLPTSGTFDGVYHRDRWGVGHFLFFVVHPSLLDELEKYDGRLIRLTVTQGTQPHNPGPALMLGIGQIDELPQPPLRIRVRTRPTQVAADQPFQLVVEITNTSSNGALLDPVHVLATIRQPSARPSQQSNGLPAQITGAPVDQLSIGEQRIPMGVWETFQGQRNLEARGGSIRLFPGASYAWVTSVANNVATSSGELKIEVSYVSADPKAADGARPSRSDFEVWQPFPVLPTSGKAADVQDETAISVSGGALTDEEDGWRGFGFKILPRKGRTVRVPGTIDRATGVADPAKYAHVAWLYGRAADSSLVALQAVRLPERDTVDGIARLLDLPETGVAITGRFRKQSRFAPPVTQIVLSVLTDSGIETVNAFKDFNDSDVAPPTAFGPPTDGVKMRIRPAKAVFKEGEPLRFHLEAVNVAGSPACWWRPFNGLGENVVLEIDTARMKQPESRAECCDGWAAEWTCGSPVEWSVTLPEGAALGKGSHTLRYTIVSEGGKYKNANDQMIPLVCGRITSEMARFAVE